jgi:hypothetical protein
MRSILKPDSLLDWSLQDNPTDAAIASMPLNSVASAKRPAQADSLPSERQFVPRIFYPPVCAPVRACDTQNLER